MLNGLIRKESSIMVGQPSTTSSKPAATSQRGVALLLVLTMVVMFTAFVADFSFSSRVKYTMASHARDAAQAESLAISGIRLYQMLLLWGDRAQGQLSRSPFAAFLGAAGTGSMVVQLLPCVDTGLLRMLGGSTFADDEGLSSSGQVPTAIEDAPPVSDDSYLSFTGDFMACGKEESTRLSLKGLGKNPQGPSAQLLLRLLKREGYQSMFREQDMTPEDLVSNIIDWVDDDGERANGQGYEDNLYARLEEPYHSKNAPFDSISELHLVAGMTEEFYAIVAPMVTAFTETDAITLPITDGHMLGALIQAVLPDVYFTDADLEQIWEQYQANLLTEAAPTTAQQLVEYVRVLHPKLGALQQNVFDQFIVGQNRREKIFRISATGRVKDVERKIEAVIDISKNREMGGMILYWREE